MENYKNITHFYTEKYIQMLPYFRQQKTKAFFNLALTLLAVSFFGIFAIGPTLSTISQLKKQLVDSRVVDSKLQEKITNLGLLQGQYNLLGTDIQLVNNALPRDPAVALLLAQINSLAQNSSVRIVSVQTQQVELTKEEEGSRGYSSFVFSIEVEGPPSNTLSFLSSFVDFDRILTLDTVSITKAENNLDKIQINALAYFKK